MLTVEACAKLHRQAVIVVQKTGVLNAEDIEDIVQTSLIEAWERPPKTAALYLHRVKQVAVNHRRTESNRQHDDLPENL